MWKVIDENEIFNSSLIRLRRPTMNYGVTRLLQELIAPYISLSEAFRIIFVDTFVRNNIGRSMWSLHSCFKRKLIALCRKEVKVRRRDSFKYYTSFVLLIVDWERARNRSNANKNTVYIFWKNTISALNKRGKDDTDIEKNNFFFRIGIVIVQRHRLWFNYYGAA